QATCPAPPLIPLLRTDEGRRPRLRAGSFASRRLGGAGPPAARRTRPRRPSRRPARGRTVDSLAAMSSQFIFTMHKVSRFHPPDREVLTDISLSFFPGAKIGVLG